jgi:hypothetical protein
LILYLANEYLYGNTSFGSENIQIPCFWVFGPSIPSLSLMVKYYGDRKGAKWMEMGEDVELEEDGIIALDI